MDEKTIFLMKENEFDMVSFIDHQPISEDKKDII